MKRTLLLLLIVSSFLMAASDTDTLSIMVNVKSIFSLEIDRHIVDFKTLLPGQMMRDMPDNEGVKVTAKSNNGNGWVLKISNLAELFQINIFIGQVIHPDQQVEHGTGKVQIIYL